MAATASCIAPTAPNAATSVHVRDVLRSTRVCLPSSTALPSLSFPKSHCNPRRWPVRAIEESSVVEEVVADSEVVVEDEEVEFVGNDELVMYFKLEGVLAESSVGKVTKALEAIEGVKNVKVSSLEGSATVELTKITSVQETGVASGLVEAIQACGFTVQTLSLSFDDDVENEAEFFKHFRSSTAALGSAPEAAVAIE